MDTQMHTSKSNYQPDESIDINRYLALLWHWAWLICLAAILAGGITYFICIHVIPIYEGKTTVLVNEAPSNKALDVSTLELSSQLTQTYSQMMTKSTVLDEVAKRLGLTEIDPKTVTAQPVANTQLITILVESTDPELAALIANTLVAVFSDQIQSLQKDRFSASEQSLQVQMTDMEQQIQATNKNIAGTTNPVEKDRLETTLTNYQQIYSNLLQSYEQVRLAEAQTISTVVQIEPAAMPKLPVWPKTGAYAAMAGIISMLLAAGLVIGRDMLDDTLKTPEEITEKLGLAVLGVVSHYNNKKEIPITEEQPRSPISEEFRILRTNLQYAGVSIGRPLRTILVTSPLPDQGKTTITINLGVVIAQNGHRVTLLDADLRRPSIHRQLGLDNHLGLSQMFIKKGSSLNGSIQPTRVINLSAVTSGDLPPNPSELLGSQKMDDILEQLITTSEVVLIDTPPALAVTDAAVLVPFVDGVVIVIKPGTTHLEQARKLVNELRRMGANLLGVILNDVDLHLPYYRYYNYNRYHYPYAYKKNNKSSPSKNEK